MSLPSYVVVDRVCGKAFARAQTHQEEKQTNSGKRGGGQSFDVRSSGGWLVCPSLFPVNMMLECVECQHQCVCVCVYSISTEPQNKPRGKCLERCHALITVVIFLIAFYYDVGKHAIFYSSQKHMFLPLPFG